MNGIILFELLIVKNMKPSIFMLEMLHEMLHVFVSIDLILVFNNLHMKRQFCSMNVTYNVSISSQFSILRVDRSILLLSNC